MNITLISRFFDSRNGGVGSVSEETLKLLKQEKGININTLSQLDGLFNGTGNINRFYHLDYLFFSLFEMPFMLKRDKFKNTDVFHALTPIEAFYADKKRTVVTVHDLMLITMPKMIHTGILSKPYGIYFKKTLDKAIKSKEIICISDESADELSKYYGLDRNDLTVVRDPIKNNLHTIKDSKHDFKDNLKTDTYTIGTISHLNKRKRIDLLIKAFLKADISNSQLLIGGTGNQLEPLQKIAGGDKRIKFLGYVADEDLNSFYNSLDVFVYPSIMEGYGLPIVEAMACSVPTITLDDAYIPNDLKNRTVVTSNDNFANVLKEKHFDVDIKSNLNFVKEHSQEKIAKQLVDVYKRVEE
ncbi:MAG: glycosyltransferase family 4 protein [Methanobrevibacter sp.]|jgi:glycosyltransferase involved in cell wall biosynthesis|nr:glycosyltransferase family 4 protein [Candidatus Methanoflexus mossambicus]